MAAIERLTIGILGGLGPYATVDIFRKILDQTPARFDQDHLHILIDNYSQIPDRSAALKGCGPSPIPAMVEAANRLCCAGADFILIPCNTAHVFLPELRPHLKIPVLSIIDATAAYIAKHYPECSRIGLLATSATLNFGLYAGKFNELLVPDPIDQEQLVMEAIFGRLGIKAGHFEPPRELLLTAARRLVDAGAQAVILGCTEIPLVINADDLPVPTVDPNRILAQTAVEYAMSGHNLTKFKQSVY